MNNLVKLNEREVKLANIFWPGIGDDDFTPEGYALLKKYEKKVLEWCKESEPVKKQQEILHDCKTCKENVDSLTSSVSEDLEEEIQRHLKDCLDIKFPTTDIESIKKDVEFTARYFAKWQEEKDKHLLKEEGLMIMPDEQFETMKRSLIKLSEEKEQMMRDAVDAYIADDCGVGKSLRWDTDALLKAWLKYEVGTKLKVIIIKEDDK